MTSVYPNPMMERREERSRLVVVVVVVVVVVAVSVVESVESVVESVVVPVVVPVVVDGCTRDFRSMMAKDSVSH